MMNIATVCGMGFGTSMIMKLTIDKVLAAEGIKATVSPVDLGSFKSMQADIVVAPLDMASQVSGTEAIPVLIQNLIDEDEIKNKLLPVIEGFLRPTA